jgi:glycolate oxidase FAD binding subunit
VIIQPRTIQELQQAVAARDHIAVRGGATKPALSPAGDDSLAIDLTQLSGVLEYEPGEFTFTALAGTPVSLVRDLLKEHGQYLPFDPPLAVRGATLGGTVAAGLSGPGRYRFGGVRDFILGVRFIDGAGELVRGGGKVVKNAAGFDLPKLMVGSLGQYGVLAEMSFKVFPHPETYLTVRAAFDALPDALAAMQRVYVAPLDVDALDLATGEAGQPEVWVRLGGLRSVLAGRAGRIQSLLGGVEILAGPSEEQAWQSAREFTWAPPDWAFVKVPLSPARLPALEAALAAEESRRRYSLGGNLAWVALPAEQVAGLDALLAQQGLAGLLIFGASGKPLLGRRTGQAFNQRVKAALDPAGRFPTL